MAIRLTEDVGAPVVVVAVDLITESYVPTWNEWAAYIVAVGSYVAAGLGKGGPFVKNMGIASFPWAAKKIYERVRGGVGSKASKLGFQRVSRYPAPANTPQYQGVRLD